MGQVGTAGTWVLGERSDVLKRLVGDYKYLSAREAGVVLADMLSDRAALLPAETVICAVPTVNAHIRQRGFDHAALLAQRFAQVRGHRYIPLLKRRIHTVQHDLNKAARRQAAQAAFALTSPTVPKSVMLIDDIMTTGATLEACVGHLRGAGVQKIFVGVIARQPLK